MLEKALNYDKEDFLLTIKLLYSPKTRYHTIQMFNLLMILLKGPSNKEFQPMTMSFEYHLLESLLQNL
jgi:hypothetical protein